ncbi:hypothetical protein MPTK1_1g26820 [Marchantia polymorpha subsp. ruderalis]|uniref:Uncharacterized protein n=2 Tax=Marchantia polymorpha TaxID=3197 RepID=A0A176W0F3_MARPO|nr:hypothetical protein AXG93_1712s1610 [Marchantia polymorpha subsp. ruderalis]PTQ49732.1 hypothetical protein MARPO_0002s0196 [Marchantia polymorpha]BBN00152.1 hypothetical protein Mp_1g26820 [Marchantia polymorpha subsp. ruderalis]|eukprot:PTQ49732.1 hypothetical protein MARPO_0002s0196 [Marchantia polymorpha]
MGHLYALDFDGVLCDSCGESSESAVKAAKLRWPEIFVGVDADTEAWVLDSMRTVRPVVETGYENLLLVRLLLEIRRPQDQNSAVSKGLTVEGILESWPTIKPVIQKHWNETDREALVELFGRVRDDWIAQSPIEWIKANRFYPGTADCLRFATSNLYIVTTKQARFAALLLKEIAGIEIPADHIYGLGSGPKVEVLKKLQGLAEHQGLTLHFVEDRLATLRNVINDSELDKWNLYLASWGYNTESERSSAAGIPRVQVLDLVDFCAKLK